MTIKRRPAIGTSDMAAIEAALRQGASRRGPGRVVMQAPQHPYADLLASSMPELRPGWLDGIDATRLAEARGEAVRPSHSDRCAFVSRCAARDGRCETEPPPLRRFAKGSDVRCHRTEQELLVRQAA